MNESSRSSFPAGDETEIAAGENSGLKISVSNMNYAT